MCQRQEAEEMKKKVTEKSEHLAKLEEEEKKLSEQIQKIFP